MNIKQLSEDILRGDTTALARGITLVESARVEDSIKVRELLTSVNKKPTQSTYRLGLSGPPGVGKSTFIEKLGTLIVQQGDKVAVLAVDPSSELTGGSILGDKTRMEELSRHSHAFVRPSATRGHLGGVTSSLPAVIQLCEAAGFQWIIVESVGVGQSEVDLSRMVDLFMLIAQPGSGDELQGIKKGILEYVDLIVVNKADRDLATVNATKQQLLAALKIMRPQMPQVLSCSALTGQGVEEVLESIKKYFNSFDPSRREQFNQFWFDSLIISEFRKHLMSDPGVNQLMESHRQSVGQKKQSPIEAVANFFKDLGLFDQ